MFFMGWGLEVHFNMGMYEDLKAVNICVVFKNSYMFSWGGELEEVHFSMDIREDLNVVNICVVFKNNYVFFMG